MRIPLALCLAIPAALFAADKKPAPGPKGGIKTPGVQIPITSLKPDATLDTAPAWIGSADQVLLPNAAKDTLDRLDPKNNKLGEPVPGVTKPCGGTVTAFGGIWVPSCADQTLLRIDPKKWEVTAKVAAGAGKAAM